MSSRFRRISQSDIETIVGDLDKWAAGHLGAKLTWAVLADRFGFSRQSLQGKSEIKAAYVNAKQALSGGLVKSREKAFQEKENLEVVVSRLQKELEAYKSKDKVWKKRWQQIAYHVRQKGIQMEAVDRVVPNGADLPSESETNVVLKPFEKEIPPSGRV